MVVCVRGWWVAGGTAFQEQVVCLSGLVMTRNFRDKVSSGFVSIEANYMAEKKQKNTENKWQQKRSDPKLKTSVQDSYLLR